MTYAGDLLLCSKSLYHVVQQVTVPDSIWQYMWWVTVVEPSSDVLSHISAEIKDRRLHSYLSTNRLPIAMYAESDAQ